MSLFESNDTCRKRKQVDCWSDYLYSTPNSPSANPTDTPTSLFPDTSFDLALDHTDYLLSDFQPHQPQSRRHSVAVGDLTYLSSFLPDEPTDWDPQQLFSTDSSVLPPQHCPPHRRAMSTHMEHHLPPSVFFDPLDTDKIQRALSLDAAAFLASSTLNYSSTSSSSCSNTSDSHSLSSHSRYESAGTLLDLLKQPPGMADPALPTASPSDVWTVHALDVTSTPTSSTTPPLPPKKRQRRAKSLVSAAPTSPTLTLSTISPSPPITPLHTLNPGFDGAFFLDPKASYATTSLSMIQSAETAAALQPLVQQYLLGQTAGERTIVIQTSKVAQKSYGTEKRFLCPPPTTLLKGANWWTGHAQDKTDDDLHENDNSDTNTSNLLLRDVQPPKLTIQISGESSVHQQAGVLEWTSTSGAVLDNSSAPAAAAGNTLTLGKCVSKHLHIADADEKRKRVEVMAHLQLGNGISLGTFPSKSIKVISKPSKKRQTVKNMELCIHHGTTISLFNRIRSQTVSTKYLGVRSGRVQAGSEACFVARTGAWDPFVIWAVDAKLAPGSWQAPTTQHGEPAPPAIALPRSTDMAIQYNQPVVLQCVTTGLVSPIMVIRKVDKGSLALGGSRFDGCDGGGEVGDERLGDPVSQLHKVAFQIVQDPAAQRVPLGASACSNELPSWSFPQTTAPVTYLSCMNDAVGLHRTTDPRAFVSLKPNASAKQSRSANDVKPHARRRTSACGVLQDRQENANTTANLFESLDGACWYEDVTDAAVWTIVGTHSATYTFWTAPADTKDCHTPFASSHGSQPLAPFPTLSDVDKENDMTCKLKGENFTHNLDVWFGDIKSIQTECPDSDALSCVIPDLETLLKSPVKTISEDGTQRSLPILLVRKDGIVYRTEKEFFF